MNNGLYISNANWKHVKTGESYHIFGFSTNEKDHTLLVHYRSWHDPHAPIWTRPASEFFDGRFVRLFSGYKEEK